MVVKGEVTDITAVKFEIRADGIGQIKTPEFRVRYVMMPVLVASAIVAIPIALFLPEEESFVGIMPMKVFMLIWLAFMVLIAWVLALMKRVRWLKEQ